MSERRIHFSYWSDPLCVWAFAAQPKLEAVLATHGDALDVEYRVVPVFGSLPWRFSDGPWSAEGPSGRAQTTRNICREFGIEGVTGKVWVEDTPASSWSPGMAIKAVFGLEQAGRAEPGCGARYQWRLREEFFLHDRNVARRSVQLEVAERCELPVAAIERALDDGTALARLWEDHHLQEESFVRGSPTYVFDGGREILYGNVAAGIIHATVEELRKGLVSGRSEC